MLTESNPDTPKKPRVKSLTNPRKPRNAKRLYGTAKHIAAGGYAPNYEIGKQNVEKYGYVCPRDQYIYGPLELTCGQMGKIWGVDHVTVSGWIKAHKWDEQREDYWVNKPVDEKAIVEPKQVEGIVLAKQSYLDQALSDFEIMRAKVMEEFLIDVEDRMSASGGVMRLRKSAATRKAEVESRQKLDEMISVKVGMPSKPIGSIGGTSIDARTQTIHQTIVHQPVGAPAPSTRPALPSPEILEAEVSDGG